MTCKDVYCIGVFVFAEEMMFNVENLYTYKNLFDGSIPPRKGDTWKINGVMRTPKSSQHGLPEQINKIMNLYESAKTTQIKQEFKKFKKYIKCLNLEYLAGFVNIANKPEELTDSEWYTVKDLKEKVERIKKLMRNENLRESSKK